MHGARSFCSFSALALLDLQNIGSFLSVPSRTVLLNEGFTADRVYVLCSGRVKVMASSPEGRVLILRVAGPGDILGLASILRNGRYRISAETLELCELKSIPRAQFVGFMDKFSDVSHSAMVMVAREYDAALLSARRLALSTSAGGKLASALLEWARLGQPDIPANPDAPISFTMPLTHEELGSLCGLSRETVTRLLGKFFREGLLEWNGTQMLLRHPDKLEGLYC
jgi:CRP/FNR family transcriptional regulator